MLQRFEAHPFQGSVAFGGEHCAICGLRRRTDAPEIEGRLSKYPSRVQHTDLGYAALDLESFVRRDVDVPTQEGIDCLGRLLDALRALPAEAQLTQLRDSIAKAVKSNKFERMILLETFGYAGIPCPASKQYYGKRFVTWDEANSDQPDHFYKREWAYPVRFWTGRDGVDESLVKSYFGSFL